MPIHPTVAQLYQERDIDQGDAPARVDQFMQAGLEARRQGVRPAKADPHGKRIAVILVDYQNDFIMPGAPLAVPGAQADIKRFLRWFYTHAPAITTVYASLDTHLPQHIFFRSWWRHGQTGQPPTDFTEITKEEVDRGIWVPTREVEWSRNYVHLLEQNHRRRLMIWPYHALEGTRGHMLVAPISEAITWHSIARDTQPVFITKGQTPRTEYYGIFGAEVQDDQDPKSKLNTVLLEALMGHDLVYVAGEAKSHCVLESERQIVDRFEKQTNIMSRLHFLIDCASSIADVPGHHYEQEAEVWLKRFEGQGVRRARSTDPLP